MRFKLLSWVAFSRKQRFTLAVYLLLFYLLTLFVEFTKDALWQLSLWLIILLLIEFLVDSPFVFYNKNIRKENEKPYFRVEGFTKEEIKKLKELRGEG